MDTPLAASAAAPVQVQEEDPYILAKIDALVWILTGLSGIVVLARIYTKIGAHRERLWYDDLLIVVTWFLIVAYSIGAIFEAHDAGRHIFNLTRRQLYEFLIWANIDATLDISAAAFAKSAFCVTLLGRTRAIWGGDDYGETKMARRGMWRDEMGGWQWSWGWGVGAERRRMLVRATVWTILASVNLMALLTGVSVWVRCTPTLKTYRPNVAGTCWSDEVTVAIPFANAVFSGVMDLALCVIPLYLMRETRLTKGEIFGVGVGISLGIFAAITAFLKASEMHTIVDADRTFESVPLLIWGAVESIMLVTAVSLPELRRLVWPAAAEPIPEETEWPPCRVDTPPGLREAISNPVTTAHLHLAQAETMSQSSRDRHRLVAFRPSGSVSPPEGADSEGWRPQPPWSPWEHSLGVYRPGSPPPVPAKSVRRTQDWSRQVGEMRPERWS